MLSINLKITSDMDFDCKNSLILVGVFYKPPVGFVWFCDEGTQYMVGAYLEGDVCVTPH